MASIPETAFAGFRKPPAFLGARRPAPCPQPAAYHPLSSQSAASAAISDSPVCLFCGACDYPGPTGESRLTKSPWALPHLQGLSPCMRTASQVPEL